MNPDPIPANSYAGEFSSAPWIQGAWSWAAATSGSLATKWSKMFMFVAEGRTWEAGDEQFWAVGREGGRRGRRKREGGRGGEGGREREGGRGRMEGREGEEGRGGREGGREGGEGGRYFNYGTNYIL